MTRRRLLGSLAAGLSGVAGVGAYARWIEPERIELTRRDLLLAGWPADLPPLRVGHLSDLHCDGDRALDRTRRAVLMLMAARPDIVFLTGDYVTSHGEQWAPRCIDALSPLAQAPLGAFAVRGNHDWWTGSSEIVEREFRRIGVPTLSNAAARVRGLGNVWVIGVESLATGTEDITKAVENVPSGAFRFLLVHEPDYADSVTAPVGLQLSGHSHGGQVRVPGLPAYTPYGARKYVSGYYETAPHPVFVTRGVGMIGVPLRFRCPPEAALLIVDRDRRNNARL
ncbi:MAG: metallophosphoesterase [Chthonomonadales bacterium]|nr:metallophosphoesterase [Chthonomonadales bacterium]